MREGCQTLRFMSITEGGARGTTDRAQTHRHVPAGSLATPTAVGDTEPPGVGRDPQPAKGGAVTAPRRYRAGPGETQDGWRRAVQGNPAEGPGTAPAETFRT